MDASALAETPGSTRAVVPLVGNEQTDEARWLALCWLASWQHRRRRSPRCGISPPSDRSARRPPRPSGSKRPLARFERFIDRISLALMDRLGIVITDDVRQRVREVPACPAFFPTSRPPQSRNGASGWHVCWPSSWGVRPARG